jgi:phosphatidate cytidylyltransferase
MNIFIARAFTSIVLLALLIGAFVSLSPIQLSLLIAAIYLYAFIGEYIPLARQSYKNASRTAYRVGILLVATGITHANWAFEGAYFELYACIGSAILSDIGGYIFGNLFGKHLLAPTISPKKTWEGLVGSILLTSSTFFIAADYLPRCDPDWAAIIGAIFAIAALGGDLLISNLKRAANVKDTGNILPGHGGILDRLDSIIGTTIAFLILILICPLLN